MTRRAGVAEGAFREAFTSVEEGYRAAFDEGLARLSDMVDAAAAREEGWLERVRAGLVALLGFFDDEPSWAGLLLLETPLDGTLVFECRQRLHKLLAALLERGDEPGDDRCAGSPARSPVLAAAVIGELVVGGVFSVIRTSMLDENAGRLVELAPSLMAFIVAPQLGRVAAQAELEGRLTRANATEVDERAVTRAQAISCAAELPVRATRRTTMVLRAIARAPYSSNREIADAAGITDEGQASKLLARLERRGVVENVGVGAARGEPNAWRLTHMGRRALELFAESLAERASRRASRPVRGAR